MRRIRYVPGPIAAAPAEFHTLPDYAPNIDDVFRADITRIPSSFVLGHGGSGVAVPHADGVVVGHAGLAVGNHVFTQPGNHSLTPDTAVGAPVTNALGQNGAILQTAAVGAVAMGTCIDVHAAGAVDAHAVTPPNDHPAADIALALIHDPADIAAALINHANSGVTPLVNVPTVIRRTARTFTLNVATLAGDILTLAYHEVGSRVLVS